MSKQRKTFTLDPEVKAYLDAEGRNASETVNRLVKLDMGEEVVNTEIIKMRMEMEKDKYEAAAQRAKGHLERYNQLQSRLENQHSKKQDKLKEAREAIGGKHLTADNPAVKNWAEKCDMTPEELLEELDE
jgi:multidrug resistance efflux pump